MHTHACVSIMHTHTDRLCSVEPRRWHVPAAHLCDAGCEPAAGATIQRSTKLLWQPQLQSRAVPNTAAYLLV